LAETASRKVTLTLALIAKQNSVSQLAAIATRKTGNSRTEQVTEGAIMQKGITEQKEPWATTKR
jgi:hypothetical protein